MYAFSIIFIHVQTPVFLSRTVNETSPFEMTA